MLCSHAPKESVVGTSSGNEKTRAGEDCRKRQCRFSGVVALVCRGAAGAGHEVSAALVDSKFRAQLFSLAVTPFANSPADLRKFIVEYTEKWEEVIHTAPIKAE